MTFNVIKMAKIKAPSISHHLLMGAFKTYLINDLMTSTVKEWTLVTLYQHRL
jgi:hypothetical protein